MATKDKTQLQNSCWNRKSEAAGHSEGNIDFGKADVKMEWHCCSLPLCDTTGTRCRRLFGSCPKAEQGLGWDLGLKAHDAAWALHEELSQIPQVPAPRDSIPGLDCSASPTSAPAISTITKHSQSLQRPSRPIPAPGRIICHCWQVFV